MIPFDQAVETVPSGVFSTAQAENVLSVLLTKSGT
jgi:hypothetical protein